MKTWYLKLKYQVFRIRNFEILGFPHVEFEILGNFEGKTSYFENLEFRLNSRYREDYYILWLFLFFANVQTATKRRCAKINIKSTKKPGFHTFFEVLGISLEIPSISNSKCEKPSISKFLILIPCISIEIEGF